MIVVGADNEYIPKLLGYETAKTMNDALRMAGVDGPSPKEVTLLKAPPIVMADVTVPPAAGAGAHA